MILRTMKLVYCELLIAKTAICRPFGIRKKDYSGDTISRAPPGQKSCQICVKSTAEQFLSNNKADLCHSNNSSLKNCVLRIPGSHNSKCAEK